MPAKGHFKVNISPEKLKELHLVEGKSCYQIAKELGVSRSTVLRYLKRMGIPHRTFKVIGKKLPEWACGYVAGMIDGEGTVTVLKYRNRKRNIIRYEPRIFIDNTNIDLLKKIREICGCGSLYKQTSKKQESRQNPLYRLSLSSDCLRSILPQILPYLICKRRQAEILMEVLQYVKLGNNQFTQRPVDKLENLINELRKLNRRGIRAHVHSPDYI